MWGLVGGKKNNCNFFFFFGRENTLANFGEVQCACTIRSLERARIEEGTNFFRRQLVAS